MKAIQRLGFFLFVGVAAFSCASGTPRCPPAPVVMDGVCDGAKRIEVGTARSCVGATEECPNRGRELARLTAETTCEDFCRSKSCDGALQCGDQYSELSTSSHTEAHSSFCEATHPKLCVDLAVGKCYCSCPI